MFNLFHIDEKMVYNWKSTVIFWFDLVWSISLTINTTFSHNGLLFFRLRTSSSISTLYTFSQNLPSSSTKKEFHTIGNGDWLIWRHFSQKLGSVNFVLNPQKNFWTIFSSSECMITDDVVTRSRECQVLCKHSKMAESKNHNFWLQTWLKFHQTRLKLLQISLQISRHFDIYQKCLENWVLFWQTLFWLSFCCESTEAEHFSNVI